MHFTVMVITDTPEELDETLQPFHEYECTGNNDQYVVWVDEHDEKVADYNNPENTTSMVANPEGTVLFSKWGEEAERFWKKTHTDDIFANRTFAPPDGYTVVEVPVKEIYPTLEAYLRDYEELEDDNFLDGRAGCMTNPNSQWDWWVIGGRWEGKLLTRDGIKVDQALKCDIDYSAMMSIAREEGELKYDEVQEIIAGRTFLTFKECREKFNDDFKPCREFYHAQPVVKDLREIDIWMEADDFAQTREEYSNQCAHNAMGTFAILHEGVWMERDGCAGLKGDEDATWYTMYSDLLDSLPDDKIITIVDCHI